MIVTEKQVLDGVLSGKHFGFVQRNSRAPERWGEQVLKTYRPNPLNVRIL